MFLELPKLKKKNDEKLEILHNLPLLPPQQLGKLDQTG